MEDGEPLELTDEVRMSGGRSGAGFPRRHRRPGRPESPGSTPGGSAAHPARRSPPEESLDDFLASLPELPEELDIPDNTPPLKGAAAPDLPRELAGRLDEAELQDLVRRVVQETVERLARELVPPLASEAIERELARIKKRLAEPD